MGDSDNFISTDSLSILFGLEPNIVFLLQSLMIVDHLLPVVDWSSTINHSLSKLASPLGIMSCYLFVAKNSHILSNKSFFTSLTKFVQTILKGGDVKLSNGALDWDLALASEFGIGRLLELGGLRKHDSIKSSAEGEIVLPSDFVQDICLKIYHEASAKVKIFKWIIQVIILNPSLSFPNE